MTSDKAQRVAIGCGVLLAAMTYVRRATKGERLTPRPLLSSAAVAGTCAVLAEFSPDVAAALAVVVLAGAAFNPAAEVAGTIKTVADHRADVRANSTGGIPRAAPGAPWNPGLGLPP